MVRSGVIHSDLWLQTLNSPDASFLLVLQRELLASLLRCYLDTDTPQDICTLILGTFWGLTRTPECRPAVIASGAITSMFAASLSDAHVDTVNGLDSRVLSVLALANLQRAAPELTANCMLYSVETVVTILRSLLRHPESELSNLSCITVPDLPSCRHSLSVTSWKGMDWLVSPWICARVQRVALHAHVS